MSELSYANAAAIGSACNKPVGMNSSMMNPLLAKLYYTHGIHDDGLSTLSDTDRANICHDVAQLLEMSERPSEREMATDILLSLMREAQKNLKAAMADRLSMLSGAPLRLILQFINDDIDVAKSVLSNSPALNDLDLLYIIQSRDSPFWQAIAERKNLAENVVETLVDTKDIGTARTLVLNKTVQFNDYAIGKLAKIANDTNLLNDCLIDRSKSQKGDFARKIYACAGDALKQMIAEQCGAMSKATAKKIDEVIKEFTDEAPSNFMPTASMFKAADVFMAEGKLTVPLMLTTLKRGQISSFIAQLSRFTKLPVAIIIPMLQQKNGHSLAIAAKANDISKNDFLMMFNFTRKIMGEDYLNANYVSSALVYYDRMTPAVAKRLVYRSQN